MRLLLDTHLLIWAAEGSDRLSPAARQLMDDGENDLLFSVVSLWEFLIKKGKGRIDMKGDAATLRTGLLQNAYAELCISAAHVLAVGDLPAIHGDPFDRLLLAQARVEGLVLLTADATVASYPGAIRKV